jgi:hypothetical protein
MSSWHDFWRYSITDAGKPGFFSGTAPFMELDRGGAVLSSEVQSLRDGGIYQGGNAKQFETLTGFRGDEILYVGDHIYGDIIHSKGTLNWRTMLIIEELEEELPKLDKLRPQLERIYARLQERELLDEKLQRLRSKLGANTRHASKAADRGDAALALPGDLLQGMENLHVLYPVSISSCNPSWQRRTFSGRLALVSSWLRSCAM